MVRRLGDDAGVMDRAEDALGEVGPTEVAGRHVDGHVDLALAVKITHVGQRAREHPVGQSVDELGRFHQRQEPLGREEPVHGVLPADECLDGIETAVRESRFGLVMQDQLVGVDRMAKLAQEREVGGVVVVLVGVVANRTEVLLLGDVQSHIGSPQELADVVGVVRREHVADARLDGHGEPAEVEVLADHVADASEERVDLGRVVDEDPELVTAQSGDRVAVVQLVDQTARELGENHVTVVVTERVVDLLESIDVDDRDRKRGAPTRHAVQRICDSPMEQPPVRELRQRVVLGKERVQGHLPA